MGGGGNTTLVTNIGTQAGTFLYHAHYELFDLDVRIALSIQS